MPEASLQSGEGDSEGSCHCRERGHESLGGRILWRKSVIKSTY